MRNHKHCFRLQCAYKRNCSQGATYDYSCDVTCKLNVILSRDCSVSAELEFKNTFIGWFSNDSRKYDMNLISLLLIITLDKKVWR